MDLNLPYLITALQAVQVNNARFVSVILHFRQLLDPLKDIPESDPQFSEIVNVYHSFIDIVHANFRAFFTNQKDGEELFQILLIIINSSSRLKLSKSFISIMQNIIYFKDEYVFCPSILDFIRIFFQVQEFSQEFDEMIGIKPIWQMLTNNSQPDIRRAIFNSLNNSLQYHFTDSSNREINDFLHNLLKSLPLLSTDNIPLAISFLVFLIGTHHHNFYLLYEKYETFNAIQSCIIQKKSIEALNSYSQISQFVPLIRDSDPNGTLPLLKQLFFFAESTITNPELLTKVLNLIQTSIKMIKPCDLRLNIKDLFDFSRFIAFSTPENKLIYFDIISIVSNSLCGHTPLIVSSAMPLFTPDLIESSLDINPLISFIQSVSPRLKSMSINIFSAFFNENNQELLLRITTKYPEIIISFHFAFSDEEIPFFEPEGQLSSYPHFRSFFSKKEIQTKKWSFFKLLLSLKEHYQQSEIFDKSLTAILSFPKMLCSILDSLLIYKKSQDINVSLLLNLIHQTIQFNRSIIQKHWIPDSLLLKIPPLYKFGLFSLKQTANFYVYLSNDSFDEYIDQSAYNFISELQEENFKDFNISKMIFGIEQEKDSKPIHLIFPSLIYHLTVDELNFILHFSLNDIVICSKYGLDRWLEKTKKPINEFPIISSIAPYFILYHHYELLLDHPELCSSFIESRSLKKSQLLSPMIDFSEGASNTSITIPFASLLHYSAKDLDLIQIRASEEEPNIQLENDPKYLKPFTFAFWFSIMENDKEPSEGEQMICSINGLEFVATSSKLQIRNQNVSIPYKKDKWYLLALIFPRSPIQKKIILNNTTICNLINEGISSDYDLKITISGNEPNFLRWCIKTPLLLFNDELSVQQLNALYSMKRKQFISLYNDSLEPKILKVFNHETLADIPKSIHFSPFCDFISHSINGPLKLFQMITADLTINKLKENHLKLLISLQKLHLSRWSITEFSIYLRIIYSIFPELFDETLLDDLKPLYLVVDESHASIGWKAFLSFILGFFRHKNFKIHFHIFKIFQEMLSYQPIIDENLSNAFARSILCPSFNENLPKEQKTSIGIVLEALRLPLEDWLSLYTLIHKDNFTIKNVIFSKIKKIILEKHFESLTQDIFSVLSTVDPESASSLLYQYLINQLLKDNLKDLSISGHYIFNHCLLHCDLIQCWSIALVLLLQAPINLEESLDFEYSSINVAYIHQFMLLFSVLASANLRWNLKHLDSKSKQDHSLWIQLYHALMTLLNDLSEAIDFDEFSLSILLSLGAFIPESVVFPLAPNQNSPEQIVNFSIEKGQEFYSSDENLSYLPNTFEPINSPIFQFENSQSYNVFPQQFVLPPPFDGIIKFQNEIQNEFEEEEKGKLNDLIKFSSWVDFYSYLLKKFDCDINIEIDSSENNLITVDIFQFIINVILKHFDDEERFKDLLNHILLSHALIIPRISCFVFQRLMFLLLDKMMRENLYSSYIIEFTCDRIHEGWFSTCISPILSFLLAIYSISPYDPIETQKTKEKLVKTLMHGFELVPASQFHIFTELFITHHSIFDSPEFLTPSFYLFLFSKLIKYHSVAPESTQIVCQNLLESISHFSNDSNSISGTEDIKNQMFENTKDEDLSLINSLDLSKAKNYMSIFSNEGYEKYFEALSIDTEFQDLFIRVQDIITMNDLKECRESIINSLESLISLRQTLVESSCHKLKEFLVDIESDEEQSQFKYDALKFYQQRMKILDEFIIMRLLESKMTELHNFDHQIPQSPGLPIFSDIVFPTRRIESSPALPDVNQEEILSKANFEYNQTLMTSILGSEKQLTQLFFSNTEHTLVSFERISFQYIINKGHSFKAACPVKFKHSASITQGYLYLSDDYLIFLEDDPSISCIFANWFASGQLGPSQLFNGHFVVKWPLSELCSVRTCQNELIPQNTISNPESSQESESSETIDPLFSKHFELGFLRGWIFILYSNDKVYHKLIKLRNQHIQEMPNKISGLSPLASLALCCLDHQTTLKSWKQGLIRNFTYILYLNYHEGRSYADFSHYPIVPMPPQLKIQRLPNENDVFFILSALLPTSILEEIKKNKTDLNQEKDLMIQKKKGIFGNLFNKKKTEEKQKGKESGGCNGIPHVYVTRELFIHAGLVNMTSPAKKWLQKLNSPTSSKLVCEWISSVFHVNLSADDLDENSGDEKGSNEIDSDHLLSKLGMLVSSNLDSSLFSFPIVALKLFDNEIISASITPHEEFFTDSSTLFADILPNYLVISIVSKPEHNFIMIDQEVKEPLDKKRRITAMGISRDGAFLALAYYDNVIQLYQIMYSAQPRSNSSKAESMSVVTQMRLKKVFPIVMKAKRDVKIIAFSSIHFLIVTAGDKIIERIDAATGKSLLRNGLITVDFEIENMIVDDRWAVIIATGKKTVGIWSISGYFLNEFQLQHNITSLTSMDLPEDDDTKCFALGLENGTIQFWNLDLTLNKAKLHESVSFFNTPVNFMYFDEKVSRGFAVSNSVKEIISIDFIGTEKQPLASKYLTVCPGCKHTMDSKKTKICSRCKRVFCNQCQKDQIKLLKQTKNKQISPLMDFICPDCKYRLSL